MRVSHRDLEELLPLHWLSWLHLNWCLEDFDLSFNLLSDRIVALQFPVLWGGLSRLAQHHELGSSYRGKLQHGGRLPVPNQLASILPIFRGHGRFDESWEHAGSHDAPSLGELYAVALHQHRRSEKGWSQRMPERSEQQFCERGTSTSIIPCASCSQMPD